MQPAGAVSTVRSPAPRDAIEHDPLDRLWAVLQVLDVGTTMTILLLGLRRPCLGYEVRNVDARVVTDVGAST